jgi:transcription-repair coupling factor (superfamily II helicase)
VRGGIVDVFPTAADHAVRIEFFGDDVESLRAFSVGDQRSIGPVERSRRPAREVVIDEDLRAAALEAIGTWPQLADELDRLARGSDLRGRRVARDPADARARAAPRVPARGCGDRAGRPDAARRAGPQARRRGRGARRDGVADRCERRCRTHRGRPPASRPPTICSAGAPDTVWRLTPFDTGGGVEVARRPAVGVVPRGHRHARRADPALLSHGMRVVVSADADGPAGGSPTCSASRVCRPRSCAPSGLRHPAGRVEVVVSPLRTGVRSDELGLALLGTWDVFGPRRQRAGRRLGTRKTAADTVLQLEPGDAVVHRTHGVGRFGGMVTRELADPDGRTPSATTSWSSTRAATRSTSPPTRSTRSRATRVASRRP